MENHLILVILAYECDLIDLDQMSAACRAWSAEKSQPLVELLVSRGWISAEDQTFLEKQLERKLAKHQHDPRITLNAIIRGDVCQVLRAVDDSDINNSLSSWSGAGPLRMDASSDATCDPELSNLRYTWVSEVGKGGLGRVWLARDNDLAREVALKEIKPESATSDAVRRLIKEAQITGQLQHPNIVPVYEVNRGGRPFYTMKLVNGESFAEAIARHHKHRRAGQEDPLSMPRLMRVFINVCDAIAYAHSRGIIHRDLKPHNIVLGDYGEAIVLDWGLARQIGTEDEDMTPVALTDDARTDATRAGATLGTPAYMAPEQALGRVDLMDQRTDIYGLGAILFELLTGRPPHRHVTDSDQYADDNDHNHTTYPTRIVNPVRELLIRIATGETPRVRECYSAIAEELDEICARAMARKRDDRFQSAKDLKAALLQFQVHEKSIELTADAAIDLIIAERESDYRYFNRALYGFEEALRQWPENIRAAEGIFETRTAYAKVAFLKGDLDLAWSHLSPTDPAHDNLRVAIQKATDERSSRKERIRQLRRLAVKRRKIAERERLNAIAAQQEEAKQRAYAELKAEEERRARMEIETTLARSNFFLACNRWEQGRLAEAREILDLVPERFRNWEWYYTKRHFAGSDCTLFGHDRAACCVTYSPDGNLIATGSEDGTIKLWRADLGTEIRTLTGHTAGVNDVSFSPDGCILASGSSDKTIRLWNVQTGEPLQTLSGHRDSVACVRFSPDGELLGSASWDDTIRLWDRSSSETRQILTGHSNQVTSLSFCPDGRRLASASFDKTVRIWSVRRGVTLRTLTAHTDVIESVCYSPDGRWLASASSDHSIKLWDPRTGAELRTLSGHQDWVTSVSFSPSGERLISTSFDRTIKMWDVRSGKQMHTFGGHTAGVRYASFSRDGQRIASASEDNTIKLWDGRYCSEVQTITGHTSIVRSASFSADGRLLATASGDGAIKVWDARQLRELHELRGHTADVRGVAFSPDGIWLASASDHDTIKLWNVSTGTEVRTLIGHAYTTHSVSFSPNGQWLVSASGDTTIMLWDVTSGEELRKFHGHSQSVNSVCFHQDGWRLASASGDRSIKLWDARDGALIRTQSGHSDSVKCVRFSPDGRYLASASADRTIKIWDVETGAELRSLAGHTDTVNSVAFSPDGWRLASASDDRTIKIWDPMTGDELRTLWGHTQAVTSVNFSPDGWRLMSASSDTSVKIWDAREETNVRLLVGHSQDVRGLAFSADGQQLFSEDRGGHRMAWCCEDGNRRQLEQPPSHLAYNSQSSRSADGRWLALAEGPRIRLVDLAPLSDNELVYRDSKARLDPRWHQEQAEIAESLGARYAALFHYTWQIRANPNDSSAWARLMRAVQPDSDQLSPTVVPHPPAAVALFEDWNRPLPKLELEETLLARDDLQVQTEGHDSEAAEKASAY